MLNNYKAHQFNHWNVNQYVIKYRVITIFSHLLVPNLIDFRFNLLKYKKKEVISHQIRPIVYPSPSSFSLNINSEPKWQFHGHGSFIYLHTVTVTHTQNTFHRHITTFIQYWLYAYNRKLQLQIEEIEISGKNILQNNYISMHVCLNYWMRVKVVLLCYWIVYL